MKTIGMKETKEQRFKRIAAHRTQKVLNDLRLLGNCSKKNSYKYNKEDITKIFVAIDGEIKRVKSLFTTYSNTDEFKL